MTVFAHSEFRQHEQVAFFHDEATGLKALIAVHSTRLGPALGGCRMWDYATDEQALRDVLRLSRGMTYKAAVAGLPLGGGKSVIMGDARKIKSENLMRAMGRAVDTLGGRYIIAEDVGTAVDDMNVIHRETRHVVGISKEGADGVVQGSGDPSPSTAYGVYVGIKAAARRRLGQESLKGLKIAVQGLGSVGYNLCRLLAQDDVQLFVTDIHADRVDSAVKDFGAAPVALEAIYDSEADIFSPCALGAILNDDTVARLKAKVVAGAANNQLAELRHGDLLKERGILYAPDFVINAGGLIHVYYEYLAAKTGAPIDGARVKLHVERIDSAISDIFNHAEREGVSTAVGADFVAERKIKAASADQAGGKG